MAFITSQGVMNSPQNRAIRELLMERSNLVSAIRLPNNLFSDHSGTDVGSDLIILQKSEDKESLSNDEQLFIESNLRPSGTYLNGYFRNLERIVHTDWRQDTDPYGKPAIVFKHRDGVDGIAKDMTDMLRADFTANFNLNLYKGNREIVIEQPLEVESKPLVTLYDLFGMSTETRRAKPRAMQKKSGSETIEVKTITDRKTEIETKPKTKTAKVKDNNNSISSRNSIEDTKAVADIFELGGNDKWSTPEVLIPVIDLTPRKWEGEILSHYKEGSLVVDSDSVIGYLRDFKFGIAQFHPITLKNEIEGERAISYIAMRDCYYALFNGEMKTQSEDAELRRKLNELYDSYRDNFGVLSSRNNNKFILMDVSGRDILSLERCVNGEYIKADIFEHPVAFSLNEITEVDDVGEALSASLNRYGTVKLDYIEKISGQSEDVILRELKGKIYYNPISDEYEVADKFIAGNVVYKAQEIESYLLSDPDNTRARESLTALQESRPQPISFEELDFNLGERWIPAGVYSRYISYLYDTQVRITYSDKLDDYSVKGVSVNWFYSIFLF